MIEILATGALSTVQDLGRHGSRRYGVGASGVMDPLALRVGNILLGNAEAAAGIEIQIFPFEVRFAADLAFALTGADCAATLDGTSLPPWWTARARSGQVLALRPPSTGSRAYLTVEGGIDVPLVLGSRSTHLRGKFGGHRGRQLQRGDVLRATGRGAGPSTPVSLATGFGVEPPHLALPSCPSIDPSVLALRVLRAAEYDRFPAAAQQRFWSTPWKITPRSDRGGFRLAGPPLLLERPIEMRSHGILPGIIQVPPAGEPIIQLSDANTAGGYPKIATVIEADLWRLGQARLGGALQFTEVTYAQAVAASRPIQSYVDKVRSLALLFRERTSRVDERCAPVVTPTCRAPDREIRREEMSS